MSSKIPTFNQYADAKHRDAAERHGLSLAEAREELPAEIWRGEWRDAVVDMFNDGFNIPTRMWRAFDEGLQYRILRSTRALRDDALTRELRAKLA